MAFDRITDGDLLGKGNLGRPDTPGVDTAEMQRILDELPRELIVPAFNRLADQLETSDAAASLGAVPPESLPEDTPATVQGVLEAALNKNDEHIGRTDNPHAVTAAQTGAYTKEETDAAISQRVTEIGAGDMARAVYDPTGQKRDVLAAIGEAVAGAGHMEKSVYAASGEPGAVDRALRADSALAADDGVKVYTHTKSGTVHNFAGSGANGRAKLTADVQAGDTFTVNGVPVAAYVGADSAADAMAGGAWNGRWVSFTVEGGTLNFKGGGGKVTVTGLAAGAVKKGTTVTVKQGAKTVASVVGTYKGVPCLCYCCVYCHPDDWNGTRATLTSFDPSFIDTKNAYSTNGGSVTFTIKRSAKIRCYSSGAENYNHNRMTIKIDGTTLGDGTMLTVNNGSKITIPYNAPGSNRGRAGAFCIFESD